MTYRLGFMTGITIGMMLIAGLLIGANAVAADEPRPDVDGLLESELFHANGSVAIENTEPRAQPPGVDRVTKRIEAASPDTPRYDAALRQHLIAPLLRAMIWVADFGTGLGYGLASVIGAKPTVLLAQGGALALIAVPVVRVYRLFEEVRHE